MAQAKNQDKEATATPGAQIVMSPEDLAALVPNAVTAAVTALAPLLSGAGGAKIEAPEPRLKIKFTANPGKYAAHLEAQGVSLNVAKLVKMIEKGAGGHEGHGHGDGHGHGPDHD